MSRAADPRVTVADIEVVTGLRSVTVNGPPGSVADRFNFIDRHGRPILVVTFFTSAEYYRAKTIMGRGSAGTLSNFHADVDGIGDEAFDAPASAPTLALYVRKGANAFLLMSMLHQPGTTAARQPRMSPAQLRRLARIIVSRL